MRLQTSTMECELAGPWAGAFLAARVGEACRKRGRTTVACAASTYGFTFVELILVLGIIAILVAIALPMFQRYIERERTAKAVFEIAGLAAEIKKHGDEVRLYPATLADIGRQSMLDPWGNPYQYLSHDDARGNGGFRKDKNIVPINSDFDLYSMGPDGRSAPPLTARFSRDDIIRANDGSFIGVASDYDP